MRMNLDVYITRIVTEEGVLETVIIRVRIQGELCAIIVMTRAIKSTPVENCRIDLRSLIQPML